MTDVIMCAIVEGVLIADMRKDVEAFYNQKATH